MCKVSAFYVCVCVDVCVWVFVCGLCVGCVWVVCGLCVGLFGLGQPHH